MAAADTNFFKSSLGSPNFGHASALAYNDGILFLEGLAYDTRTNALLGSFGEDDWNHKRPVQGLAASQGKPLVYVAHEAPGNGGSYSSSGSDVIPNSVISVYHTGTLRKAYSIDLPNRAITQLAVGSDAMVYALTHRGFKAGYETVVHAWNTTGLSTSLNDSHSTATIDGEDLSCIVAGEYYLVCGHGEDKKYLSCWDRETNARVQKLKGDTGVTSLALDETNDVIYSGGNATIAVWDTRTSSVTKLKGYGLVGRVTHLAIDDRYLYSAVGGGQVGSVMVWDIRMNTSFILEGHRSGIAGLVVGEGSQVYTSGSEVVSRTPAQAPSPGSSKGKGKGKKKGKGKGKRGSSRSKYSIEHHVFVWRRAAPPPPVVSATSPSLRDASEPPSAMDGSLSRRRSRSKSRRSRSRSKSHSRK